MPIPPFNEHGLLPEGIHESTVDETGARFGAFQLSDRRPRLWSTFQVFLQEARACGLVEAVLLDGSFVTARPDPNDIDLVVIVTSGYDFAQELRPGAYNVLSKRSVRRRLGFDIVLARSETDDVTETAAFFQQIRGRPDLRKGILRIRL